MYAQTGKIRDIQLCLKNIKESKPGPQHPLPATLRYFRSTLRQLKSSRENFLNEQSYAEMEQSLLHFIPPLANEQLLNNFFTNNLNAVNTILAKPVYKDHELHSVRKHLKDLLYVMKICNVELVGPLAPPYERPGTIKKIDTITHTLGLYNDLCVSLSLLKKAAADPLTQNELQSIAYLRRHWLRKKRALKKEILRHFPSLRFPLDHNHSPQ
jgi:hypothetical protein